MALVFSRGFLRRGSSSTQPHAWARLTDVTLHMSHLLPSSSPGTSAVTDSSFQFMSRFNIHIFVHLVITHHTLILTAAIQLPDSCYYPLAASLTCISAPHHLFVSFVRALYPSPASYFHRVDWIDILNVWSVSTSAIPICLWVCFIYVGVVSRSFT